MTLGSIEHWKRQHPDSSITAEREHAEILKTLEDVPGTTAVDKVRRLKEWYLEFQKGATSRGGGWK